MKNFNNGDICIPWYDFHMKNLTLPILEKETYWGLDILNVYIHIIVHGTIQIKVL